jgi:hypothetical protein
MLTVTLARGAKSMEAHFSSIELRGVRFSREVGAIPACLTRYQWEYAFYALALYGRVAGERTAPTPEAVAMAIAERRGIDLGAS